MRLKLFIYKNSYCVKKQNHVKENKIIILLLKQQKPTFKFKISGNIKNKKILLTLLTLINGHDRKNSTDQECLLSESRRKKPLNSHT